MRESEIEKILVYEVKKLGGIAYKWVSPGNDGVPDRIVVFPDRKPVFVELKTEKFRPEFTGKLNLYVAAVNKQMKTEQDNPTIGILICKDKNEVVTE